MPIFDNIFLGNTSIGKGYLGSTQIYPPESGGPLVTETKGFPDIAHPTTSSVFGGSMSADTWITTPITVSGVSWKLYRAGTYELRVDGVLRDTKVVADASVWVNFTPTPFFLDAGIHEFSLVKTSGSGGWAYSARDAWCDDWLNIGYWKEATGGELALFNVTAERAEPPAYVRLGSSARADRTSGLRVGYTFPVTFAEDRTVLGMQYSGERFAQYRVKVDGVSVGTSPLFAGSGSFENTQWAIWTRFDTPVEFSAGVSRSVNVSRVDGSAFNDTFGSNHLTPTPYGDPGITVGPITDWEHITTYYTPWVYFICAA